MNETSERATCKNCGVGIGDCGKRPRHRFRLVSEEMPSSSAEQYALAPRRLIPNDFFFCSLECLAEWAYIECPTDLRLGSPLMG